ncbi:GMC family oxidoreductase [Aspergillus undulatus]|uniref:GMC family oxidoreductase n=1 Tax=Aspergillus undulatus TaxID=1810928 RepID=UPI003CCCFB56
MAIYSSILQEAPILRIEYTLYLDADTYLELIYRKKLSTRILCVKWVSSPRLLDMGDLKQVREYVKDQILIYNHATGRCAMGDVVDERLKVKGLQGLRVVDASIISTQISGNIVATVYSMVKGGADIIIEDTKIA